MGRMKCKTGPCNKDCHWNFLVNFTLILALFNWPVHLMYGHFVKYNTYDDISKN